MRRFVLLVVLVLVVVACGDSAEDAPSTTSESATSITRTVRAPTSDGCDKPLAAPGEIELHNVVGDVDQPYWLVIPENYADLAPAPLYLHLASGGVSHDEYMTGWRPWLDDLDGLMAMVNTTAPGTRESATLIALIDHVSDDYCIDESRVHVMGTSWSAPAAEDLACAASDRIASFVGGSDKPRSMCQPVRPVPFFTMTGDPDRAEVTEIVDKWVDINGCDPEPVVEDLGSGVFRKTYQNCAADIVFYDIEGMGHQWPMHDARGNPLIAQYEEVDYLEEAMAFFAAHPLP